MLCSCRFFLLGCHPIFVFIYVFETGSQCVVRVGLVGSNPGCLQCTAVLLPQPPSCWVYSPVAPYFVFFVFETICTVALWMHSQVSNLSICLSFPSSDFMGMSQHIQLKSSISDWLKWPPGSMVFLPTETVTSAPLLSSPPSYLLYTWLSLEDRRAEGERKIFAHGKKDATT